MAITQGGTSSNSTYDKLLEMGPNGSLVPELAESWVVSDDGTSVVMQLRPGLQFHDGAPLDSDAVEFNLVNNVEFFPGETRISRVQEGEIDEVIVIDALTIEIRFLFPYPNALEIFRALDGMMVSPFSMGEQPVGAGSFRVVDLKENESMRLEAFPEYWAGPRELQLIDFFFVPEESTRIAMLQTGEVEMITSKSPGTFAFLSAEPSLVVCGTETDFYSFDSSLGGVECFPDGQMRLEQVVDNTSLRIAVTEVN